MHNTNIWLLNVLVVKGEGIFLFKKSVLIQDERPSMSNVQVQKQKMVQKTFKAYICRDGVLNLTSWYAM